MNQHPFFWSSLGVIAAEPSVAYPGIQIRESGYGDYGTYMSGDWDYVTRTPCAWYQVDVSASGNWHVTGDMHTYWSIVNNTGGAGVSTEDITFTGFGNSSGTINFLLDSSTTIFASIDLTAQNGCD